MLLLTFSALVYNIKVLLTKYPSDTYTLPNNSAFPTNSHLSMCKDRLTLTHWTVWPVTEFQGLAFPLKNVFTLAVKWAFFLRVDKLLQCGGERRRFNNKFN